MTHFHCEQCGAIISDEEDISKTCCDHYPPMPKLMRIDPAQVRFIGQGDAQGRGVMEDQEGLQKETNHEMCSQI